MVASNKREIHFEKTKKRENVEGNYDKWMEGNDWR